MNPVPCLKLSGHTPDRIKPAPVRIAPPPLYLVRCGEGPHGAISIPLRVLSAAADHALELGITLQEYVTETLVDRQIRAGRV